MMQRAAPGSKVLHASPRPAHKTRVPPRSRHPRLRLLLLTLAVAAAPAGAVVTPGVQVRTLDFGGITRSYRLRVPASYTGAAAVPLVIDLHGFSSNAIQQESLSGMQAVAEREGFIVVYPDGVNAAWNAGICCGNLAIDDVG